MSPFNVGAHLLRHPEAANKDSDNANRRMEGYSKPLRRIEERAIEEDSKSLDLGSSLWRKLDPLT